jgi:hypothetical protein
MGFAFVAKGSGKLDLERDGDELVYAEGSSHVDRRDVMIRIADYATRFLMAPLK